MLRHLALCLIFVSLAGASKCRSKYREFVKPAADIVPCHQLPFDPVTQQRPPCYPAREQRQSRRRCVNSGTTLGEEYWSSVGYDGKLRDGRTVDDFVTFSGEHQTDNVYVAYWITQSKYADTHYEVFGHAYVNPDNRFCALFVGQDREIVEVCEGFRILSRNRHRPTEELPFEWVKGEETAKSQLIGFHGHRISKTQPNGEVFYGDANHKERVFRGINTGTQEILHIVDPEYSSDIWLLRRKDARVHNVIEPLPQQPPRSNVHVYADPHKRIPDYQFPSSYDNVLRGDRRSDDDYERTLQEQRQQYQQRLREYEAARAEHEARNRAQPQQFIQSESEFVAPGNSVNPSNVVKDQDGGENGWVEREEAERKPILIRDEDGNLYERVNGKR